VAYTYFQNWRDKVYNVKTGTSSKISATGLVSTLGLGTGYKKSAIIMMIGNSRAEGPNIANTTSPITTTRSYILQGIWPKDVGPITLDYSTENIATFPVNFSVDYFEPYSLSSFASSTADSIISSIF
jgi:hypothetical protein